MRGSLFLLQVLALACLSCNKPEPMLRLTPGQRVTLIDTQTNNGSFEDWTNASEPPLEPHFDHLTATPDRDLTIPGWTLRSDRGAGFSKRESSSHLKSRFVGGWHVQAHLISDAYAKGAGFVAGTELEVSFDLFVHYNQAKLDEFHEYGLKRSKRRPGEKWGRNKLIEVLTYLVLDGSDKLPEEPDWMYVPLEAVYVPDDHKIGDYVHARGLKHRLTAEEADAADEHGVRLYLVFGNANAGLYAADKVRLTVLQPTE